MIKKFVLWPLFPIGLFTFLYRHQDLFVMHNKKFFDMCNVGIQYEIGRERNEVLKQCNELIDAEDF